MVVNACISQDTKALEDYDSTLHVDLNSVYDSYGDPLLLIAIKNNKPHCFNTLVSLGVDIENPSLKDGATALNLAAKLGSKYYVEQLIALGADVNTRDAYGDTPINNAIFKGNYSQVEYFLSLPNVNVNIPGSADLLPIFMAYVYDRWDIIDKIIAHPLYDPTFTYLLMKNGPGDLIDYVKAHGPEIDQSLVELHHDAKLFGLKYDFPGCFTPKGFEGHGKHCFSFEGYSNANGIQIIAYSFDIFFHQMTSRKEFPLWAKQAFSIVRDALEFSKEVVDPQEYSSKIMDGSPVLIPSGWRNEHSIAFVIHNDRLYRCNRGSKSDGIHGIDEFIITKLYNLTPEVIGHMLAVGGEPDYLQTDIIELLGLEHIGQVENPTQIAGNCVWTSLETGVEALFITTYLSLGLDDQRAHDLAKSTFLLWEKYDLNLALNKIMTEPELLLKHEIYDDLLINIIESHHDASSPDDVERGVIILDQLNEPTVFATFDQKIGRFVMEYDPLSYKKISYMESYTPSYYDYFMGYISSPSKKLSPEGLEMAKEYFDFLVACDDYKATHPDHQIRLDEVIDLGLSQLFELTVSDTPAVVINNTTYESPIEIPQWHIIPLHEEAIYL